jgi:hypothetical protein
MQATERKVAAFRILCSRLAILVALVAPLVTSALACSCVGNGPPCQEAWFKGTTVFVGRVYWISTAATKDTAGHAVLHRTVKIKTLEPFVGDVSGWVNVETGLAGGDCGFDFKWWEKYVIYAHRETDGTLTTSICTRTRKVSDADVDLTYLRQIKYLPNHGRVYGRVALYTYDPDFKPAKVSTISPDSPGWEEQFLAKRPLPGTVVRVKSAENGNEQTRYAAENGDFAFEDLSPGKYVFSVDLPAVMTPYNIFDVTVPARGCCLVNVGTAYNGRLAGKVSDQRGAAISYVPVEVIRASDAEKADYAFQWISAKKDGTFLIGPLPPGDYVLGVRVARFSGEHRKPKTYYPGVLDLQEARRIHLREGQLIEGLDFKVDLKQVPD